MKTVKILSLLAMLPFLRMNAQEIDRAIDWSEADIMGNAPYGLRMGFSATSFAGSELKNAYPMLGYTGGFYYRWKPNKKKSLTFQNELNIHFQGSNFDNKEYGSSGYRRITLLTLEMPFYWSIPVGKWKEEDGGTSVIIGPQLGFNVRSAVLQGNNFEPVEKDNYLSSWKSLPFRPIHLNAVIGLHHRKGVIGYQVKAKWGLTNLNNNFVLPKNLPVSGTGGTIFPWSIELGMVF